MADDKMDVRCWIFEAEILINYLDLPIRGTVLLVAQVRSVLECFAHLIFPTYLILRPPASLPPCLHAKCLEHRLFLQNKCPRQHIKVQFERRSIS